MLVTVTEYIRPNGRKVVTDYDINEEQAKFFIDNDIELSVEEFGTGAGTAWYAKHPAMEEEEEILFLSFSGNPNVALTVLWVRMGNWLAESPLN